MQENTPELWKDKLPIIKADGHKYDRGHAVIYGAFELTGATRLAASACARVGAGLTTVLAPNHEIAQIFRSTLPAHIMVRDDINWTDSRVTARLYGPGGMSIDVDTAQTAPTVLDADAILNLPEDMDDRYILTPHAGEFQKAFPDLTGHEGNKASQAAQISGAIIVLKGSKTIIAHPDGRLIQNTNASPYLASAGTGDVLAGMITGLYAQGMDPFYAACSAVWIHGEAGARIGLGLVASDIPDILPSVFSDFA